MTEMCGLVSVIIPCYNQATYLPDALESVLNQTNPNWECIIVNDGSPDQTETVALNYCNRDKRFIYLKKENGGLSSARNAGIKIARGEYIQFLDADDIIELKKLEVQANILKEDDSIDLVYSPVRYFSSENVLKQYSNINLTNDRRQPEISGSGDVLLRQYKVTNIFAVNCPLVKRTAINRVGLFNELLRSLEDYDFWNRLALKGAYFHFDNTKETFALVRVHKNSMSKNSEVMSIYFSIARLYFFTELLNRRRKGDNLYSRFEFREMKRFITYSYLNNMIDIQLYSTVLNSCEKLRLRILKFIPKRIRYQFMVFDRYETRRLLKKYF